MSKTAYSKQKKMFITAAPVGAVPKLLDPTIPRFIPDQYVSVFSPESKREGLAKRLKKEGWSKVQGQGMSLKINAPGFVSNDDLRKLDKQSFEEAVFWLEHLGWRPAAEGWSEQIAASGTQPVITAQTLAKIPDQALKEKFAFGLSLQGWQVNAKGDLSWPHERGETYFDPELVRQLQRKAPAFVGELKTLGWEDRGEGYWLKGGGTTPYLPLYPDEIVKDAYQSTVEGAAMVHLHTRDLTPRPYYIPGMSMGVMNPAQHNKIDVEQYDHIVPAFLDKNPNVVLNLSTSARGGAADFDDHQRRAHLKFYGAGRTPDVGSFSPGPVIFQNGGGYENPNVFLKSQMAHMKSLGVRPEIEVFNHTILDNATGHYAQNIRDMGAPAIFMLVTGVDQYKDWPKAGLMRFKNQDDSLIPVAKRKKIFDLIKTGEEADKQKAVDLTVQYLRPVVERLRTTHPGAKISTLMMGNMQLIATDVAVALDLDGIRIGLEDGLSTLDKAIPGGVRRALGTADQVKRIRSELEMRGIHVQSAEELREDLGIERPEIKMFREIEELLSPYSSKLPDFSALPAASEILSILEGPIAQYKEKEDLFVDDMLDQLNGFTGGAEELAQAVQETAFRHGIAIRYFLEEADRYKSPGRFKMPHMYTVQPLNFMREVLNDRSLSSDIFDKALKKFAVGKGLLPSVFIPANQFKDLELRFLDYATFISSRYNVDRTEVVNTHIRQDERYSATMSVLFHAAEDKLRKLRATSAAPKKKLGPVWYRAVLPEADTRPEKLCPKIKEAKRSEVAAHVESGGWVALPSTPTTNYPTGHKLMEGLTSVLQAFLVSAHEKYSAGGKYRPITLVSACHSGIDRDGQELIEASMLKNRFALNTDRQGVLSSYSVQQIYDQLLLPRILSNSEGLQYQKDGTVLRNEEGLPVDENNQVIERLSAEDIESRSLLKLIGHSSGIATMQQLDNLLRADMDRYGFTDEEKREVFNKSVLVHFGTACNVNLENSGTTVIDVTAANDIRSIAGRTDKQVVDLPTERKKAFQKQKLESGQGVRRKMNNSSADVKVTTGAQHKSLLRYWPVFLSEDPARLHDGHTIKRYVGESPEHVKALVAHLSSTNRIDDPQTLIDEANKMIEARNLSM